MAFEAYPNQLPTNDPWSLATERRFRAWTIERELPLVRRVYPFLIILVLAFGLWDYLLDPDVVATTWPLRIFTAATLTVVALLLKLPRVAFFWREITFGVNSFLFTMLLLILVQIENGPVWGMAGLLLSAILFRVHSPVLALTSALANAALVVVLYDYYSVPEKQMWNTQVFLLCASSANALLNYADNQRDRELFALSEKMQSLATTDALTGAANRRIFSERLDAEIERATRYQTPLCLILLDIDFFKKVNDTRGHGDGDIALKTVASVGLKMGRGSDLFARLGGEEFVVLLPHTEIEAARALAERMRAHIEATPVKGDTGLFSLTASFGVASFNGQESANALTARADTALYRAKQSGRNRVVCAEQMALEFMAAAQS